MNAHEVLVRGRNRIATEGWAKRLPDGSWWFENGVGECANNSLLPSPDDARGETYVAARAALEAVIESEELYDWNDDPDRTKEEVLAAFDEAIRWTAPPPADPLADVDLPERVGAAA